MAEVIVELIEEYGLSEKSRSATLFSKVGLVGCGTVGQNIALMISQKELEVVFIELSEEKVNDAMVLIDVLTGSRVNDLRLNPVYHPL